MRPRLALPVAAAMSALLLSGCGEAVGDPPAQDASERAVLRDAAEMLPDARNGGDALPRGRDALPRGRDALPRGRDALPRGRDAPE